MPELRVAHVEASLRRGRAESEALATELEQLARSDWDRISACPDWTVRVLIGHTIRSADSYVRAIERGLRGDMTDEPLEERVRRQEAIAAQAPARIVADLREIATRFDRTTRDLMPDRLETLGRHSFGPRTAAWFADQRLIEVAFHRLDLHATFGRRLDLDPETGAVLLPMILDMNLPSIMARDRPCGEGTFRLVATGDHPASWTVVAHPIDFGTRRDGGEPVGVTIEADPAALAMLVYGRRTVEELEREGRLRIDGDRAQALRWGEIFRTP
jgi:uncharacterized protein (TIGR03083 family)